MCFDEGVWNIPDESHFDDLEKIRGMGQLAMKKIGGVEGGEGEEAVDLKGGCVDRERGDQRDRSSCWSNACTCWTPRRTGRPRSLEGRSGKRKREEDTDIGSHDVVDIAGCEQEECQELHPVKGMQSVDLSLGGQGSVGIVLGVEDERKGRRTPSRKETSSTIYPRFERWRRRG